MPSDLPAEVSRSVKLFLTTVDELAPGLVTGFYLVGSIALGDFHAGGAGRGRLSTASDIDFIAVTDRRPEPGSRELTALAEAHARTVACYPRPHFDGSMLCWADLAAGPDGCPAVPCAQESRFTPAGRAGLNPVTFCELAWHGIALRGPQPSEIDLWADSDALRAFTIDNLRSYWRPWWHRHRQPRPLPLLIGLSAWFPVWAVLGVSRLHHFLATATMTSKCGAGRYAQNAFAPRWRRIIDESLALRTDNAEGRLGYRNPLARRRDTLAFLDTTIEAALALPAEP
ncbi:nucleotidyltransferase domain-containing protein [Nocardia sp. CDC159]|uniref:Nucleotidyltransferase domain-containing protein n=1 Tax=Nocardia pulmonis TaxID=2951408 RepID=A0A9X2E6Q2_9NOCA|nr:MULTISPECIES: nucleotidyltransferase domain-containing protein [Nocardia]MCM6775259.1 nucleotidyltransferase domain-containing protein [Nocardia pulmonis]MCM6788007.1 nucleotidyltransferase domain-containing protein [Nocardia sp. CDC159]